MQVIKCVMMMFMLHFILLTMVETHPVTNSNDSPVSVFVQHDRQKRLLENEISIHNSGSFVTPSTRPEIPPKFTFSTASTSLAPASPLPPVVPVTKGGFFVPLENFFDLNSNNNFGFDAQRIPDSRSEIFQNFVAGPNLVEIKNKNHFNVPNPVVHQIPDQVQPTEKFTFSDSVNKEFRNQIVQPTTVKIETNNIVSRNVFRNDFAPNHFIGSNKNLVFANQIQVDGPKEQFLSGKASSFQIGPIFRSDKKPNSLNLPKDRDNFQFQVGQKIQFGNNGFRSLEPNSFVHPGSVHTINLNTFSDASDPRNHISGRSNTFIPSTNLEGGFRPSLLGRSLEPIPERQGKSLDDKFIFVEESGRENFVPGKLEGGFVPSFNFAASIRTKRDHR